MIDSFCNSDELHADVFERNTIDNVLGNVIVKEACGETNLNSGLDLVSCENPKLDTGVLEGDDGLLHVFL